MAGDQDGLHIAIEFEGYAMALPVGPEQLRIEGPGTNETEEVVGIGEVNRLRRPGLREVSIESFLPTDEGMPYVLTTGKFEEPAAYVEFFERIRDAREPCQFALLRKDSSGTVTTVLLMQASIEQFDWGYEAQDTDVYYSLELKEYRQFQAKVVTLKTLTTTRTGVIKKGSKVYANGLYHKTPFKGSKTKRLKKNYAGIVLLILPLYKKVNGKRTKVNYRYLLGSTKKKRVGYVGKSQLKLRK